MITLVRHGEAAAGWGDHPDPGLSDLGHTQAETIAMSLGDTPVHLIISSPMQRCRETAAPLAKALGLTPIIAPEVSEIPTPENLDTDRVIWLKSLMAGPWTKAPPLVQAWRHVLVDKINTLPDNTVVFSHFVAINAVVSALEGREETVMFRPAYCSQTRLIRRDGVLQVERRGDEAATRIL